MLFDIRAVETFQTRGSQSGLYKLRRIVLITRYIKIDMKNVTTSREKSFNILFTVSDQHYKQGTLPVIRFPCILPQHIRNAVQCHAIHAAVLYYSYGIQFM